VRQKVPHRRTLCYLEQLILKHDAHEKVISLKETREGMDFHFAQRSHAQRFSDFVESFIPAKLKTAKHLVSHDANSNNYHYKYTIMNELCPVCTDDLVAVPPGFSDLLNAIAPLVICHKMSTSVHLIDPLTLKGADIPAYEYWKKPFPPAATKSQMTEFTVLNVEIVDTPDLGTKARHHLAGRGKMKLADVEIAKSADLGHNDERLIVRSHLGAILRPGNKVLGYDLRYVQLNAHEDDNIDETLTRTDVFLVRKVFNRKKNRAWELRRLDREREDGEDEIIDDADMEAMKQELEEDPELRRHVNMYRAPDKAKASAANAAATAPIDAADVPIESDDEELDENAPEVPLAELLEGLDLGGKGD